MKKRFWALLIAMLMVLQLCPATSLASAQPQAGTLTIPTRYNPLYPNAPKIAQRYYSDGAPAEDVEYEYMFQKDYQKIVSALRKGLVDRVNTITISFLSRTKLTSEDLENVFEDALKHTSVPTEGDTLRFAWHSFGARPTVTQEGDVYFYTVDYLLTYYTDAAQEAALTEKVNTVMQEFNFNSSTTDLQKITAIYNYITANVRYDHAHEPDPGYLLQFTPYAALINGTAVCQGYAALFYRLCLESEIDARTIIGYGNGGDHVWNIVSLNGKYYNVDATWDEGQTNYRFFLKGSNDFGDHAADEAYTTEEFKLQYPMHTSAYSAPAPHKHIIEVTGAIPSDCLRRGYSEGRICITCNEVLMERTLLPLGDHTPVVEPYRAPTCTAPGYNSYTYCSVCEEPIGEIDYIHSLSHDYALDSITFSTCTEQGYEHYKCTRCDATVNRSYRPTILHDYENGKCTECGKDEHEPVGAVKQYWNGVAYLYADGKLTIYVDKSLDLGYSTALPNVASSEDTPWAKLGFAEDIVEVVIEQGVTVIGNGNFSDLPNLLTVTIADSVTSIGMSAFENCQKLQLIKMPKNLKYLGSSAFEKCISLESIILPEKLTALPVFAFQDCTALKKVALPNSLTTVEAFAFKGCSALEELTLPTSVTTLNTACFSGMSALTSMAIPEGVTNLTGLVFSSCTALKTLYLPASLQDLGSNSNFEGCYALSDIHFAGSDKQWIALNTYENDNILPEVELKGVTMHYRTVVPTPAPTPTPEPTPVVTLPPVIHGECGTDCTYTFENGVLRIKGSGKTYDFELTYSDDYTQIFSNAPWFEYNGIGFADQVTKIVTEEGVRELGYGAFAGLTNVTSVQLAESTTRIGGAAFCYCSSLTEISGLDPAEIQSFTFDGCTALKTLPPLNNLSTIQYHAFRNCTALETLHIGNMLFRLTIPFEGCSSLTDIYFDGTKEQWEQVEKSAETIEQLKPITIHCSDGMIAGIPVATPTPTPEPTPEPTPTPTPTPTPAPVDNPFTDIAETDWFYAPVMWAKESGVTGGKTATTFAPNENCTRAQVVTFIWAANGKPEPKSMDNPFKDVADNAWYLKPVLWAVEQGITGGIGEGLFGPEQTCNRAQIVTFLYAAAGKPAINGNSTFIDVANTDWYAKPVIWAAQNDVTGGIGNGKFGPLNSCTRAQVVTFLYKVYG